MEAKSDSFYKYKYLKYKSKISKFQKQKVEGGGDNLKKDIFPILSNEQVILVTEPIAPELGSY